MSRLSLPALAAAATLALAAPAAAQTTVSVPGVPAAGPSKYDKSFVTKIGPSSAKTVLVLVSGYGGGAGGFLEIGKELTDRIPGLQVWAFDRRTQAFEDTSLFDRSRAGTATPQQVFDYYIGWITNPSQQPRFTPQDPKFAAEWGLPTAIGDLHRVVRSAKRGGRRVILGGHSLGGSMTGIYATWDFNGRPGYRDLDGLVMIDGGPLGAFRHVRTRAQVRDRLEEIEKRPFADLIEAGLPWASGVFLGIGSVHALREPTAPSPFDDYQLLPAPLRPPFQVTNRGMLGYALDVTTSPPALGSIHVRAGSVAPSGDPRDWVDGEASPIERVARYGAQSPVNSTEWYFPERLRLDVDAANALRRSPATQQLKLRPFHLRDVDVPIYVFQTDLTRGRLLSAARQYIARSDVPRSRSLLVDRKSTTSHLDPLTAAPGTNDFLKTVVPWLRSLR